ncbi:MAG: hypothetical protein ACPG77_06470, partial [Nannocystaceae bacterium]
MAIDSLIVARQLADGLAQPTLLLEYLGRRGVLRMLALEHLVQWLSPAPVRPLPTVEEDVAWPGTAVVNLVRQGVPEGHEEAIALAKLAVVFANQWGSLEVPAWRAWKLPAVAALAWARSELLIRCEVSANPVVELDLQALASLRLGEAVEPEKLVVSCLGHPDGRVQDYGLGLLSTGVLEGLLEPLWAHRQLVACTKETRETKLLSRVLVLLAEPWARLLGGGEWVATTLEATKGIPGVAMARLGLARVYRHQGVLCACIDDNSQPLPQRKAAIAFWAEFATREHLSQVLNLGRAEPMLFGGEAISFTRALHRRGHFVVDV